MPVAGDDRRPGIIFRFSEVFLDNPDNQHY